MTKGEGGVKVLRDANDELHLMQTDDIEKTATTLLEDNLNEFLAERRHIQPILEPQVSNLSLEPSGATPIPPQAPDFHSVPKIVFLPSPSLPYTPRWTPLFNFDTYFAEIDAARKRSGRKSGIMRRDNQGSECASPGDLVWYGETVTSTQTMLDRYVITSRCTGLSC